MTCNVMIISSLPTLVWGGMMSVSFDWGGMVTVCQETVPMSEDARYRVQGDRSVVNTMAGSYRDIYLYKC